MQFKHLSLLALASLVAAQDNNTQDLNSTLSSADNLSTLRSLVAANPDLLSALASAQDITILAPSDEAFSKLTSTEAGKAAAENADFVRVLLTYHVLNGTFRASDISETPAFVPTLLMNETYANVTGGQRVEAVVKDDNVVFYTGLMMNSTVTQADVNFTGGVIHIIDTVLTIPEPVTETALAANLTALYGAVNATGLVSAVKETPDLTIFAPTNEAFQAIASALQNASTEDISSVLAYHVVNGTVGYSSDLEDGQKIPTLNGEELTITIRDGNVFVNAAQVVVADVLVANGVVHVIDNVLNPASTATPSESATGGAPAFSGATSASEVPYTSGVPTPSTTMDGGAKGPDATPTSTSSEFTGAAARPMMTGAVGVAALFGAAAFL